MSGGSKVKSEQFALSGSVSRLGFFVCASSYNVSRLQAPQFNCNQNVYPSEGRVHVLPFRIRLFVCDDHVRRKTTSLSLHKVSVRFVNILETFLQINPEFFLWEHWVVADFICFWDSYRKACVLKCMS